MSSHEQLNNHESRQGLFGPAELVQYETGGEEVQLAERYTQDGTRIDWEDHLYTANADRRVLITDREDNAYYLLGDTLYDLSASMRNQRLMGFKYREASAIPRLTIGESAPFSQADIKEVAIGLDRARPEDPVAQDARPKKGGSPFDRWEILLSGLPQHAVVDPPPRPLRPEQGFMTDENGKPVVPVVRYPRTFVHGPGLPENPTAKAEVTRLSGWLAKLDLGTARPKSRHGIPISPRPGVPPPDISETYKGDDKRYKRFKGKTIADVSEEDRKDFSEAIRKERTRKVQEARYEEYVPRLGARMVYALTRKNKR